MTDRAAFALRGLDQIDMAGRGAELAQLDAALGRAVRFQLPQRVTLSGAAGVGKSRLCSAWCRRLAAGAGCGRGGASRLRGRCGCAGRRADRRLVGRFVRRLVRSYDVVAAMLRRRFGLDHLDAVAAQMKLRDEVYRVFGDRRVLEVSALLGSLLGFAIPDSPLAGTLARWPRRTNDLALAVLARFLERDAAQSPLVFVLEDLHRADDRSLDILQALPAELGGGALLIVASARPELLVRRPGWGAKPGEGGGAPATTSASTSSRWRAPRSKR